jgi:hypothetical protein
LCTILLWFTFLFSLPCFMTTAVDTSSYVPRLHLYGF